MMEAIPHISTLSVSWNPEYAATKPTSQPTDHKSIFSGDLSRDFIQRVFSPNKKTGKWLCPNLQRLAFGNAKQLIPSEKELDVAIKRRLSAADSELVPLRIVSITARDRVGRVGTCGS